MKLYYQEKIYYSANKGLWRKTVWYFATETQIFVISKELGFQKCIVYPLYFKFKQTAYFQNWLLDYL